METPDYYQGASKASGHPDAIKLSSNENAYGHSPLVDDAIRANCESVHRYPEDSTASLDRAIAEHWGIDESRVLVSTGSDDLLPTLMRAFMSPGEHGLYFSDSFPKYRLNIISIGAHPVEIARPSTSYCIDADQVSKALTPRSRILFLDTPANPSSVAVTQTELVELHQTLPGNVILALDEAYIEFSDTPRGALDIVANNDNIVIFRTFSKAFGLAGLRIGWCYGPAPIIDAMRKLRPSFPLTGLSIKAALAAISDTSFLSSTVERITATRDRVIRELVAAGWSIPKPQGNFFMLRYASTSPMSIKNAGESLLDAGILVRPLRIQNDEEILRITIGTDQQMDLVINVLGGTDRETQ